MIKGKKPLEQAMDAKRVEQTQNVKQLTTSNDAYSPERRIIRGEKKTPQGAVGKIKVTTDQVNLKEEAKKMKDELGQRFRVTIEKPNLEFRRRKDVGKAGRKKRKKVIAPPKLKKPKLALRGGGRAYGKNS
jgi:hypothetical protein